MQRTSFPCVKQQYPFNTISVIVHHEMIIRLCSVGLLYSALHELLVALLYLLC